MTTTPFAALRVRDYRRYFLATLLAMTADNIEHVISYWVMFQTFHAPALGGFAVISHWLPFLVFSFHAGALADRYDRCRLVQVSQALFIFASLAWALLFLTGTLRIWHAAAILVVHGVAGVVGAPAAQLIPEDLLDAERLPSAIRLTASSRYLSILLGPAVGGGLMLLLGPAGGLLANALLYLPLSLLLLRLPDSPIPHRGEALPAGLGLREARRVLGAVRSEHGIAAMVALGGVTSLLVGNAFQAQMPEYAHDLGADATGVRYSVLLAANAASAVFGAVVLEASRWRPSPASAMAWASIWAITMAVFPMAASYPMALALLLLAGVTNIAFTSMAQTLVQIRAPAHLRGRVLGLFNTAVLGLQAGSGVTVGLLGALVGVHCSLALSAAALVVACAGLLVRERRRARLARCGWDR